MLRARSLWDGGKPLEAGRTVAEALPDAERPRWAGELLAVVYLRAHKAGRVLRVPALEHVLSIASDARRWMEARDAQRIVRSIQLEEHRKTPPDLLLLALLGLGEVVAKVTYNASGGPEPFERNASWRVASGIRPVLEELSDPALEAACVARLLCEGDDGPTTSHLKR